MKLEEILRLAAVIPVVIIDDVKDAVPLARALVAGGLPVIEVTLRTAAGLDAIRAIAEEVPDAVVGVGTVLSEVCCRTWRDGAVAGCRDGA
jgi:2-dehydro-3-deoxyphosphogluconate aldolase/(4S)-4-hydroxy-2-oxoglutarate aldolase